MNGLLGSDMDDPKTQGIMQLALAMLAGSGPSPVKQSFGSILGKSGMMGMDAYNKQKVALDEAEQRKIRRRLLEMQTNKIEQDVLNETQMDKWISDPANLMAIKQPQSATGDYGPGEAPTVGPQESSMQPKGPRDLAMSMIRSGNPMLAKLGFAQLSKPDAGGLMTVGNNVFDTNSRTFITPPQKEAQDKESEAERLIRRINDPATSPSELPMLRARLEAMNYKAPSSVAVQLQSKEDAKGRVSENLQSLAGAYYDLDRLGAAVSNRKEPLDNIIASVRSSKPGQIVERAIGTQAQTVRDRINQMRPLLIQEIRQATQMGARGLDSNRELEFYLQAATDPSWSIESNIAAMSVLDKAYGLGLGIKASPSAVNALRNQFSSDSSGNDDGWSIRPKK